MAKQTSGAETAAKLRKLADGMQQTIDNKLRPMTQNWTPKRGREYSQRVHEGNNLQRAQQALRTLADLHEDGTCPPELADVKTKALVCAMTATRGDSNGYYDWHDTGEFRDVSNEATTLRRLMENGKSDADREREAEQRRASEIQKMENDLRGLDIPGFFPTPKAVGERVIELAEIGPHDRVLEPSAGIGSLAELCPSPGNVDCYEIVPKLADVCSAKGFAVSVRDFMDEDSEQVATYDRIVMNPPFEKGGDARHVMHAYKFLRPHGRLVAVMSEGPFFRSQRADQAFRDWFRKVGGLKYEMPVGSFTGSAAFRQTGVASCIVVIDKAP